MANSKQIKILKQGAKAWNKWRDENDIIKPDLHEADLSGKDLCNDAITRQN